MSIVSTYTRAQWEQIGGWKGVPDYVDGITLLWDINAYPEEDIEPQVQRVDPATGQLWPEDAAQVLTPVPFTYYARQSYAPMGWEQEDSGASMEFHTRLWLPRPLV